jgi:ABC-type branched-subunit amino acid transport system substrate-binding protein
VEQDKVFALCCTQSLNTNAAITPYLDEVRVPNVGVDGLNDEQYKGAYTFPIGTASVPLGNLTGTFVPERLGAKKAALICENVSGGKQFCDAFQKNFEAKGGRVVYSQTVNPDEADLTPFVLQARAQGSEIITGHIDVVVAIRLLQAAQAQGWKPPKNFAFGTGVYVSIFPEYTGSISEGTVVMNHNLAWETESPGRREFRDVVSRYYDLKTLNYTPWLSLSGVSVKLFADGVRALGRDGVTREGLKSWLDNLTNWDTGWGFKVTFRPGKHVANRFGLFLQVKGGKFEPMTGLIEDKTYQG